LTVSAPEATSSVLGWYAMALPSALHSRSAVVPLSALGITRTGPSSTRGGIDHGPPQAVEVCRSYFPSARRVTRTAGGVSG
jgi:hypothetical protein